MAVGRRIERSGINGFNALHWGLDRRRGQRKEDCMRGLAAMAIRGFEVPRDPSCPLWFRPSTVTTKDTKVHEGKQRASPLQKEARSRIARRDYRLAGTFPASAADGIVVTRPCVPVACADTVVVAAAADAAAGIIPSALRTSASSLAIVSLF